MKQKLLSIFLVCVLLAGAAFAQDKRITGKVTAKEDGLPLPGVSVRVTGSKLGTQTDANGNYAINVPDGSNTLQISYIGFLSQTIAIGNRSVINVSLETDAKQLSEVIVTGYSTSTQQAFTGSAKVVSADNLERKSVSNVSQALSGEVAGLNVINTSGQPGTTATIRIRGFGSVNGNRDPLYVVDGAPIATNTTAGINPLSAINPDDIESATVLKDAAATAIYGSRGANGVIVITTKSGRGKPSFIEVNGQTGTNISLLPRYSVIKSPEQFIALSWESLYNRGVALGNANPVNYANTRLFSTSGIDPDYNMWNVTSGADLIDPTTRMVKAGVTRKFDPENWEDYGFQNSARNEANVKFGGSNGTTNYYSSLGYLNDIGYSINSDFKRLSGRLNLNQQIKKWLTGSINLGYTKSTTNRGGQSSDSGSIFWFADNIPPIYPLFLRDANGAFVDDPIFGGNQYDYGSKGRGFSALTNAIADASYDIQRDKRNDLNGTASLKVDIIKGLSFETRLGIQYYNNIYNNRNNKYYGSGASQNGSLFQRRTELVSNNFLNLLRYSKQFGQHGLEVLAAHESTDFSQSFSTSSSFNLVDPNLLDFNNAIVSNPNSSYTNKYKLESYFSQINYNYKSTYFLSGSIRRDGSSRFVNNKYGNFGSVGAAWLISNESFMEPSKKLFPYLKVKASYGLIGDQEGIGYYPGYDLYNVDNLNDQPAFSFNTKGNPDLTWETAKIFQTGVEFDLGKYLSGSVDYYVKNTNDLIFDRRVGPSIGYALIKVNDGKLKNQGLEFDLTGHALKSKDFKLDISVNGALYKNELTQMPIDPATGKQKILDVQGNYGYGVGHSIYDFYVRNFAGVDKTTGVSTWTLYYNDANNNNTVDAGEGVSSLTQFLYDNPTIKETDLKQSTTKTYSSATQYYVGKSAIPKIRGAFNISAGYKRFDLGIQMLYSLGGYAYDGAYAGLMNNDVIGGNNWSTDILNRWQKEGDDTDVPRLSNNYDANVSSLSSRFITKADYLTLNNVRLSYAIPTQFLSKISVAGCSVWVSGDNLYLASARDGFNPSTAESGSSNIYRYSPLSTISAGLKIKL